MQRCAKLHPHLIFRTSLGAGLKLGVMVHLRLSSNACESVSGAVCHFVVCTCALISCPSNVSVAGKGLQTWWCLDLLACHLLRPNFKAHCHHVFLFFWIIITCNGCRCFLRYPRFLRQYSSFKHFLQYLCRSHRSMTESHLEREFADSTSGMMLLTMHWSFDNLSSHDHTRYSDR